MDDETKLNCGKLSQELLYWSAWTLFDGPMIVLTGVHAGNGIFCYKACTPGDGSAYNLCENTFDECAAFSLVQFSS